MSSKQDVTKPHKCIFSKCKGALIEPTANYGYWAYWRQSDSRPYLFGWYSTP